MSSAKKTTKKAPAKEAAKKAPAKTAEKKAPAKKAPATKKAPAKKAPATKKAAKKAPATKKAAKKAPATKKAAKKAPAAKMAPTKAAPKSTSSSLVVGAPAPAFSLAGSDGKTHSLAMYRGRPVVLFFYPKDNTPGCTIEACDFRDNLGRAQKAGAVVFGVSRDSLKSHDSFRAKFNLSYPLLSDPERTAHLAYGAWGKKVMYGKEVEGTIRSTFLIDATGVLRHAWTKVKVNGHADEVIGALEAL